ncbi:MAG: protease HtpX [Kiritimatiellae bacterium]|nr:protease HtpX [Kiritimatiellia bacterium]
MKRALLFIVTNFMVMIALAVVTMIVCAFFGTSLSEAIGPEWSYLAIVAFVYGFAGAIVSLLMSKQMAKFSVGAKTVDGTEGEAERWLVDTVGILARQANVSMPEVAVYRGSANAFATGAFKNHALVAVSTDIMSQMTRDELRAVLGHEMSHVANGDMVTLALVQGVLNAFVIFLSRAVAGIVAGSGKGNRRGNGLYRPIALVLDIALGFLASIVVFAYSRKREYAADAGSARLLGSPGPMIAALRRLGNLRPGVLPDSLKAMGIAGGRRTSLLATHPSLDERIEALMRLA